MHIKKQRLQIKVRVHLFLWSIFIIVLGSVPAQWDYGDEQESLLCTFLPCHKERRMKLTNKSNYTNNNVILTSQWLSQFPDQQSWAENLLEKQILMPTPVLLSQKLWAGHLFNPPSRWLIMLKFENLCSKRIRKGKQILRWEWGGSGLGGSWGRPPVPFKGYIAKSVYDISVLMGKEDKKLLLCIINTCYHWPFGHILNLLLISLGTLNLGISMEEGQGITQQQIVGR